MTFSEKVLLYLLEKTDAMQNITRMFGIPPELVREWATGTATPLPEIEEAIEEFIDGELKNEM